MKAKLLPIWAYIKTHWGNLTILAIAVFFLLKDASKKVEAVSVAHSDTTRYITQITQPVQHIQTYTPFKLTDTVYQPVLIPTEYKPSDDLAELKKQVTELGNKFFKANRYRDTIYLRDTNNTIVGNVAVDDSITQNMIAGRSVAYKLSFPRETVTITNTITEPKKVQVFLGPEVSGSATSFSQVGIGGILKTKSDNIFRLSTGALLSPLPIRQFVSFGYYHKLSFKK